MAEGNGKDNDNGGGLGDNVIRIPTLAERDRMRREQEKQRQRDDRARTKKEPAINLPPVTKILLAAILFPHLAMALLLDPPGQYWVFTHFGFVPAYYTADFPGWPAFIGPFSYMFVHSNWLHVGMNAAMLAAFGAGVERWMGGRRMAVMFVLCGLAGVAFHFILSPFSEQTVVGASAGDSGLFAAVLVMLHRQGRLGTGRYGIWPFAAFWVGLAVVFGLLGSPDGSDVAWAAHIGGFLAGLLLLRPMLRGQ